MEDGGVGCSVACSRISSPHPKILKKHSNLLHHKTQKTTRAGGALLVAFLFKDAWGLLSRALLYQTVGGRRCWVRTWGFGRLRLR